MSYERKKPPHAAKRDRVQPRAGIAEHAANEPRATRPRPLAGVPVWERPTFIHGSAGPMPGGVTFGPRYPGAPTPIAGERMVCVEPPWEPGRGGLQVHSEWPPPVGPRERQLEMQGCHPTGQRCGHPVYGGQYWRCPAGPAPGGTGFGPIVGTPFAMTDTPLDGVHGTPGLHAPSMGRMRSAHGALGANGRIETGSIWPAAVAAGATVAIGALVLSAAVPMALWLAKALSGEVDPELARTLPYRNRCLDPATAAELESHYLQRAAYWQEQLDRARTDREREKFLQGVLYYLEKADMAVEASR